MFQKLLLPVILVLQVTASLCEGPTPDQELLDKYNNLTEFFFEKLSYIYNKIEKPIIEPLVILFPDEVFDDFMDKLYDIPYYKSVEEISFGVANEFYPLGEKSIFAAMELYRKHVRPWAEPYFNQAITAVKGFLNSIMPEPVH